MRRGKQLALMIVLLGIGLSLVRIASAAELQFVDLIVSRPAAQVEGTWVVGATTVEVDANTTINASEAQLAEGYCIEVKYIAGEISNTATELKARGRTDCEAVLSRRALINSFPVGLTGTWVIGGDAYSADTLTEFKQDHGAYADGVCVEVRFGEETAIATKIETRSQTDCEVTLVDLIMVRPAGVVTGTWTIGAVSMTVDATTTIEATPDKLAVGYCVEAKYLFDSVDNPATKLKSRNRTDCEAIVTERALINAFPGAGPGTWTIGAIDYTVDGNTTLKTDAGPFAVGSCVEVKAGAETQIATQVQTRSANDCRRTVVGLIVFRPFSVITGTWTIDDVTVSADATTTIEGDPDDLRVDYCAEAQYLYDSLNNPATKLKVRARTDCEAVDTAHGVVQIMPPGMEGSWIIEGEPYTVDDNTVLKPDNGPFEVTACVEVKAGHTSGIATQLQTRPRTECQATLVGLIEMRPAGIVTGTWTVAGLAMAADSTTVFDGGADDFALGYCVEATYYADSFTNPVVKFKSKARTDCEAVLTARARIDSFPPGLEGTWSIGSVLYTADPNTEFKQDKGPYAVGVCVEVKYGATTAIATKIETRETTDCTGPEMRTVDLIDSRPDGTNLGTWTVGGNDYTVNAATVIAATDAQLQVGYCIEVKYVDDGGTNLATRLDDKARTDCEALVKLRGRIDELPVDLLGTWTVAGLTFTVDANTELKDDKGPFEPNACVEMTFGAVTHIATKAETRNSIDCMGPEIRIVDFIVDRPAETLLGSWIIGDVAIEVTEGTEIAAPETALTIGSCVELKYRADGSINVAMKLDDKDRQECEALDTVRGRIDSFPTELTGTWVIDGVSYEADAATEFKQDHGAYAVDACVQVRFGVETMIATKIETRSDDDCLGPEMRVTGLIEIRPNGQYTGTWQVDGVSAEVDSDTLLDAPDSKLALGYCVELKYADDGGTNRALRLDDKDRQTCEAVTESEGTLETFPVDLFGTWVISGTGYTVDANTELKQKNGPFAEGACVRVKYGTTSGIAVKVETIKGCSTAAPEANSYERVYGVIEAFPMAMTGDWQINGTLYTADADTAFKTKKGPLALGGCARVDYVPDTGVALKIESADADHCAADGSGGHHDDDAKRYGVLESWPTELIGTWVIDGISYESGIGTTFKTDQGDFVVGACVEVKYFTESLIALSVKTAKATHCGGDSDHSGSYAEVIGTVESLPVDWLGDWQIDGATYSADASTKFKEKYNALEVGACVKVKYQTATGLALKIETRHPYDCQAADTPPEDDPQLLEVNHDAGAPGSAFTFIGENFTPDTELSITVGGSLRGTATSDSDGFVTFVLNAVPGTLAAGAQAPAALYSVALRVDGVSSDPALVQVDNTQPVHGAPGNYTGPDYLLNPVPTAAGLSVVSAESAPTLTTLALLAFGLLGLLGAVTLRALRRR